MLPIREVDRATDASALRALDTSFTSDFVYRVVRGEDSLELRLASAPSAIKKRFPLDLGQPTWDHGYAAEQAGKLYGFIATRYESWNRRLAIVHFYVDLAHRRQGIGRQLMHRAIESGRLDRARMAFVETSNFDRPGYSHLSAPRLFALWLRSKFVSRNAKRKRVCDLSLAANWSLMSRSINNRQF
jgi:ribosomal protein S18 acetylase RimI-like enzyme